MSHISRGNLLPTVESHGSDSLPTWPLQRSICPARGKRVLLEARSHGVHPQARAMSRRLVATDTIHHGPPSRRAITLRSPCRARPPGGCATRPSSSTSRDNFRPRSLLSIRLHADIAAQWPAPQCAAPRQKGFVAAVPPWASQLLRAPVALLHYQRSRLYHLSPCAPAPATRRGSICC